LLDDVEVKDLRAFEDGFYPYLESAHPAILTDIATKKALDDDLKSRLTAMRSTSTSRTSSQIAKTSNQTAAAK
jgi:F-type H+-transporting ATPase subunit alpha